MMIVRIIIIVIIIIIIKIIIIILILIIIIILFLLHILEKNVFLLPIPTEVAFYAKIFYPSLQDSIFQQSICEKIT